MNMVDRVAERVWILEIGEKIYGQARNRCHPIEFYVILRLAAACKGACSSSSSSERADK